MIYAAIALAMILAFSYFVFGITGIRVALGIFFITLPFYFILNNFQLEEGEKIIFSLLMGFTLFSSLVYLLGLVISFRLGIIITFILLVAVAFGIKKFLRH